MTNHSFRNSAFVEKSPTGIEGIDEITSGGVPRGRMTLIMGVPGSGKPFFALQTLDKTAERSEEDFKKKELEYSEAEMEARSEALKRELDMKRSELKLLEQEHQRREEEWQKRRESRYEMRRGDKPAGTGPSSPDQV